MNLLDPKSLWIGNINGLTDGIERPRHMDPESQKRMHEEICGRFRTAMRALVQELRNNGIEVLLYAEEEGKEAAALGLDAQVWPGMEDKVLACAMEHPDAVHIYRTLEGVHQFFALAREEVVRQVEETVKGRKPKVTLCPSDARLFAAQTISKPSRKTNV